MPEKKVLSVRRYKDGYEVRTELVDGKDFECKDFEIKSAYTMSDQYIGDPKTAHQICTKLGIKPEKAQESHCVCSIGFCEEKQEWFGWSHRAIHGFGVGSEVSEGDCCASSGWTPEYLQEHPEEDLSLPVGFKADNLADAKKMAIAFAESVS